MISTLRKFADANTVIAAGYVVCRTAHADVHPYVFLSNHFNI